MCGRLATGGCFSAYAIYEHPTDYPEHYVVRHWKVSPGTSITPDRIGCLTLSLDEARASIPEGLHRLKREPDDEPHVVETWC